MSEKITRLLNNKGGNYLLPFFWQHGEDEATLRKYMNVIRQSNIGAVCIESRPHPDFAGPQWWHDMDIILDEAKKLDMKVWILDDSHFPTGFANGAVDNYDESFCRQSITHKVFAVKGGEASFFTKEDIETLPPRDLSGIRQFLKEKEPRVFDDDKVLDVYFVAEDGSVTPLADQITEDGLTWTPDKDGKIYVLYLTRNLGSHTHYINMTHAASVRILIDTVYETHWDHYKEDFGKTISGFFSDEPELGNGFMYETGNYVGNPACDFPWSTEIEEDLTKALGADFTKKLYFIWEETGSDEAAKIRFTYMDILTNLVKKHFSFQIGDWCRAHGVDYIGHLIEDNDQHEMTGASLGHYFRGLQGESWAGIDDIGGQVYPLGENDTYDRGPLQARSGEFYHFMLGKLGSSAAAIEPLKNGNSMCELFGAYGWQEGVQLEKYLVDHFAVRGINHYVPHAFSPAPFPDPDCPPHFYAQGHNPQYRAFGSLMKYTNRVLELINDGRHVAPVAVLYSAEAAWANHDTVMESHVISRPLTENQIEFDFIPQDVFADPAGFNSSIEAGALVVNTQQYKVFIVPETKYIRTDFAKAVPAMAGAGVKVIFVNRLPEVILDLEPGDDEAEILDGVAEAAAVISFSELIASIKGTSAVEVSIAPANDYIRYIHYEEPDGSAVYMFVNEGAEVYEGRVRIDDARKAYTYDAWENELYAADFTGNELKLSLEPKKSYILVLDSEVPALKESYDEKREGAAEISWKADWKRSLSASVSYPDFKDEKPVTIPDHLHEEEPLWSGIARYENEFTAEPGRSYFLEITDAGEAVEVFVNGKSLSCQVVPTFKFDLTGAVTEGSNVIRIEVASTLEREMSTVPDRMAMMLGKSTEPTSASGITGYVTLYEK